MSIDDVFAGKNFFEGIWDGSPAAYGPRLIVWVDILGWEDLTKEPTAEMFRLIAKGQRFVNLTGQMAELRRAHVKEGRTSYGWSATRTHFSDTIVFSCAPEPSEVWILVDDVRQLCAFLLGAGHYTRGGVTFGNAHHDAEASYGPAFIEAYRLEKSVAYYPRLVVSDDAAGLLETMRLEPKGPVEWSPVVEDLDGLKFLEIFRREPDGSRVDYLIERLVSVRQRVLVDIERTHEPSEERNRVVAFNRRAKYVWMLRYIDSVLKDPVTVVTPNQT